MKAAKETAKVQGAKEKRKYEEWSTAGSTSAKKVVILRDSVSVLNQMYTVCSNLVGHSDALLSQSSSRVLSYKLHTFRF